MRLVMLSANNWQKNENRGETGGSTVIVSMLLVALLGFVALVVDIGLIYAERAQLQNGADSAAISVAYSCAQDLDSPDCQPFADSAAQLANANSLDSLSNMQVLELNKSDGTVQVKTTAQEAGRDPGSVSMVFADFLGITTAAVSAQASAKWGNPVRGLSPFPIVFSECAVRDADELQLVQYYKNGTGPVLCQGGPAGGFGQLKQLDMKCAARVDITVSSAGGDPGNDAPSNCEDVTRSWASSIETGVHPIGLFPVYESVTGTGSNATFDLSGFAAFEIYGWKLKQGGSQKIPEEQFRANYYSGLNCDKDCIGIIGKFVRHVSLDEDLVLGTGGEDRGAYLVRLTD